METTLTTAAGRLLRPWDDEDAAAVLTAFGAPDMAGQAGRPITDLDTARAWLTERRQAADAHSSAVTEHGTLVGSVTVSAIDRRHDTGWISYWTTPGARGHGVAADAVTALAGWALGELGLFRLELGHRLNNPASCRVAHAAGFAVEGLERAKLRYGDQRFDVELHARLATDPAPRWHAPSSRAISTS